VALGREGFAGFQQGLEAGDDIRPTDADHLGHGAARLAVGQRGLAQRSIRSWRLRATRFSRSGQAPDPLRSCPGLSEGRATVISSYRRDAARRNGR
jgi:hypothetical protein